MLADYFSSFICFKKTQRIHMVPKHGTQLKKKIIFPNLHVGVLSLIFQNDMKCPSFLWSTSNSKPRDTRTCQHRRNQGMSGEANGRTTYSLSKSKDFLPFKCGFLKYKQHPLAVSNIAEKGIWLISFFLMHLIYSRLLRDREMSALSL